MREITDINEAMDRIDELARLLDERTATAARLAEEAMEQKARVAELERENEQLENAITAHEVQSECVDSDVASLRIRAERAEAALAAMTEERDRYKSAIPSKCAGMIDIRPKMVDGEAMCGGEDCKHFSQFSRTDWICCAVNTATDPCVVLPEESVCIPYLRALVRELEAAQAMVSSAVDQPDYTNPEGIVRAVRAALAAATEQDND